MKKKLPSLCLALVLCLGLTISAAASEQTATDGEPSGTASPFVDVEETSPYYPGIRWAVEQGITTGTGDGSTFSSSEPCTRAQIAVFLWRAAGKPEPKFTENEYMDVADPSAYYYKAVQWAAEMDMEWRGTFNPNDSCDRLTAVYFMWCAAGSPEMEGELPFTDVPFGGGDENGQPLYAEADDAVLWAVAQGITNGITATTFSPDTTCTRGQIATFLYRAAQAEAAQD